MRDDLDNTISSELFGAVNDLNPQSDPQIVRIYVESYEDVCFWRNIFKDTDKVVFEITPGGSNKSFGKKSLLRDAHGGKLGENLLVCMDSDYDYLLQKSTTDSEIINDNPYIFQTYVYALENFQCHALTLADVCRKSYICDIPNVAEEISKYSQVIYKLLLLSILLYKKNKVELYSIAEYNSHVNIVDHIRTHKDRWFEEFTNKLESDYSRVYSKILTEFYLENVSELTEELNNIDASLNALSFNRDNCYLITQGHTLKSNVIHLLEHLCKPLRNEINRQIQIKHADNTRAMAAEKKMYKKKCQKIEFSLNNNNRYEDCCDFHKRICSDVNSFIATTYS